LLLNIGCSGWSYEDWKGNFYPKILENFGNNEDASKVIESSRSVRGFC
jgi:uncharacterized protein YecE (DUF72 family)